MRMHAMVLVVATSCDKVPPLVGDFQPDYYKPSRQQGDSRNNRQRR